MAAMPRAPGRTESRQTSFRAMTGPAAVVPHAEHKLGLGRLLARHKFAWTVTMVSAVSFAAEAKANPSRFYRRPSEVVRDRRLKRDEKLAILEAWELEARELAVAAEENMGGGETTPVPEGPPWRDRLRR